MAKIIIVDDFMNLAELTASLFRMDGHEAWAFTAPHEALGFYHLNAPKIDCVVVDYNLNYKDLSGHVIDGDELVSKMKDINNHPKFILHTGSCSKKQIDSFYEMGIFDVIVDKGVPYAIQEAINGMFNKGIERHGKQSDEKESGQVAQV
jgi:CheY-like chemotaxis protein